MLLQHLKGKREEEEKSESSYNSEYNTTPKFKMNFTACYKTLTFKPQTLGLSSG